MKRIETGLQDQSVHCQICNSMMANWGESQSIPGELIQSGGLEDIGRIQIDDFR